MTVGARSDRRSRKVADLMLRNVVSVGPDASVRELAGLLRSHGVAGVPVVDGSGRAVGTVSVTDLLWLLDQVDLGEGPGRGGTSEPPLETRTVRDVMTPDVFGVPPTATLAELVEFFSRTGLHRALVLEEGRVVGIVSVTDLLGLLAADEERPERAGGP